MRVCLASSLFPPRRGARAGRARPGWTVCIGGLHSLRRADCITGTLVCQVARYTLLIDYENDHLRVVRPHQRRFVAQAPDVWLGCFIAARAPSSASQSPESSLEPPYELVINGVVDSALTICSFRCALPAFAPASKSAIRQPPHSPGRRTVVTSRAVIAVDHSVGKTGSEQRIRGARCVVAGDRSPEIDAVRSCRGRVRQSRTKRNTLAGKLTPLGAAGMSQDISRRPSTDRARNQPYFVAQARAIHRARCGPHAVNRAYIRAGRLKADWFPWFADARG
jgi:hypothetical protein